MNLSGTGSSRGVDDGAAGQGRGGRATEEAVDEECAVTGLESEAMEAEFDTVAGWTEEAVRALGPEYAIPAGCRGSGSEGALRWLADRLDARARDPAARLGRRRRRAGRAGWPPSAGCGRSAPSRWPPPSGPAAGCSGCRRWSPFGQQLPFADGAVRRGLVPRRPLHHVGQGGRAGRAAPGAAPTAAGSACSSSSPTRPLPPPLPEGNEFPSEAELRRLLADAGFELVDTADGRPRRQPGGVDPAGRRRRRRGRPPARRRPRVPAGGGAVAPRRPAARRRRSPGLARGRRRRADRGCKEILAKNPLHS